MKRFPSIKKNSDFKRIYSARDSKAMPSLVMYKMLNGTEYNRLGVSAGKKIGNSVVRHTVTRKLREIFRTNNTHAVQGYDIVIVVRNRGAFASYRELERDYLKLLEDHNIFSESK